MSPVALGRARVVKAQAKPLRKKSGASQMSSAVAGVSAVGKAPPPQTPTPKVHHQDPEEEPLPSSSDWVWSAASNVSLVVDHAWFDYYTPFHSTVTIGEEEHAVVGIGRIQVPTVRFPAATAARDETTLEVANVLHVPTSNVNILGGTDFRDSSVAPPPGPDNGAGYIVAPAAPESGPTTAFDPEGVAARYIFRDGPGLASPSQALGYLTRAPPPNDNGTILLLARSGPPRGPYVSPDEEGYFSVMEGLGPYDPSLLTARWSVTERDRWGFGIAAW